MGMRVAVLLFVVSVSLTEGTFADVINANGTYSTPQTEKEDIKISLIDFTEVAM